MFSFSRWRGPSPSMIIALAALFLSMGGVGYAATQLNGNNLVARSVGSGKLQTGAVGHRALDNRSVSAVNLTNALNSAIKHPGATGATGATGKTGAAGPAGGATGATGPAGAQGPAGADGTNGMDGKDGKGGAPGLSNVTAGAPYSGNAFGSAEPNSDTILPAGQTTVVWTSCASSKAAISGGFRLYAGKDENTTGGPGDPNEESFVPQDGDYNSANSDLTVVASEPAFQKGGALVNGSDPSVNPDATAEGAFAPNAWAVTVQNTGSVAHAARVWVVCANVA